MLTSAHVYMKREDEKSSRKKRVKSCASNCLFALTFFFIKWKLFYKTVISVKLPLAFTEHRTRLDLLVHEILLLAATHVLILDEIKVIACKKVELILHLPNLRFLNLGFGDRQWIGFSFCLSQVRLVGFVEVLDSP